LQRQLKHFCASGLFFNDNTVALGSISFFCTGSLLAPQNFKGRVFIAVPIAGFTPRFFALMGRNIAFANCQNIYLIKTMIEKM